MPTQHTPNTLFECFADLQDPRRGNAIRHLLLDIVVIGVLAIIAGADDWEEVEAFAEAKQEWLRTLLALPGGIPCHDTFERVFARLDPKQMHTCFTRWVKAICACLEAQVVAIDGKAARGSFDRATGQEAIRVVSAWATEQHLVLAECTVDKKSNEIPAIKALLEILEIRGCTVTLDAMGCQKDIAAAIKAKGADYVLALKGNQGNTCKGVETLFQAWQAQGFASLSHTYHRQVEAGHGRIETRHHWSVNLKDFVAPEVLQQWPHLVAIGRVESETKIWEKTRREVRYYLMSRPMPAEELGRVVRSHWQVENSLHWVLDVTFKEDDCRVRKGNGPENLAILRRLALSLMKQHPGKGSIKKKRFRAGLSVEFLLEIVRLAGKTEQVDVSVSVAT